MNLIARLKNCVSPLLGQRVDADKGKPRLPSFFWRLGDEGLDVILVKVLASFRGCPDAFVPLVVVTGSFHQNLPRDAQVCVVILDDMLDHGAVPPLTNRLAVAAYWRSSSAWSPSPRTCPYNALP